jgi:hypothetical protein
MQKQEEVVLLAAFRLLPKKDRVFLLSLAQSLKKNAEAGQKQKSTQ